MKSDPLNKLIQQARSAPPPDDDREVAAPLGFATRVVALAREQAEAATWSTFFERKAWGPSRIVRLAKSKQLGRDVSHDERVIDRGRRGVKWRREQI